MLVRSLEMKGRKTEKEVGRDVFTSVGTHAGLVYNNNRNL